MNALRDEKREARSEKKETGSENLKQLCLITSM